MLKGLVEAGAVKAVSIIANGSVVHAEIITLSGDKKVITTDGFQAKRIIDNWIEFYNSERPHTALDKRTPDIAYFGHAEIRKAA